MSKKKPAQSETPAPVAGEQSATPPPEVERRCIVCGGHTSAVICPTDGSNLTEQ